MKRLIYIAAMLAVISLGCRRAEKIEEVAQEDINFAQQSAGEVVENSPNFIIDPGSPFQRRGPYFGYFVYSLKPDIRTQIDTGLGIDLRKKGCATYQPNDTTDDDRDRVYRNTTIKFTCNNRTDTLLKTNENNTKYIITYTILGTLNHNDNTTDNNPFRFAVSWGDSFIFYIKVMRNNELVKESKSVQTGSLTMDSIAPKKYKLIRSLRYAKEVNSCRSITLNETTYVFLDQALDWHPGDTIGNNIIKTWPIGKGTLRTCSGLEVNMQIEPLDTLKIGKCPNSDAPAIKEGTIKIVLFLPGKKEEFVKSFSCQ
ncbi:MAG: hypothetical protein RMJ38_07210 [candidate division WOR-3 bacterium]|nr:hypothetical protein [candidate division WOR-3 bacterium]MDW8151209.1 hypothetical protein [candidate division WOR-3 bacterium]